MLKHLQVHTVLREGEQHILAQVHETVHAHCDSISVYGEAEWGSGLLEAHLSRLFISCGVPPFPLICLHWLGWLGGPFSFLHLVSYLPLLAGL